MSQRLNQIPIPEFDQLNALTPGDMMRALRNWINTNTRIRIYDNNMTQEMAELIIGSVHSMKPIQLTDQEVFFIWLENRFPRVEYPNWAKWLFWKLDPPPLILSDPEILKVWAS